MEVCDLQVDVNGQQTFLVNKELLASYSSRLRSLFRKRVTTEGNTMKLILFRDFPGGPAGFELVSRFCYNNGIINITHSNVVLLNHAANYLEMNNNNNILIVGRSNLMDQTEKYLEGISYWTWSELLLALKNSQPSLLIDINNNVVSCVHILVDELVERLALHGMMMDVPSSLSSKCSSFRSSCDSKSTQTTKTFVFQRFWWFEDLSELDICLIEMVVRKMVMEKCDHFSISKFLFYFQRTRVYGATKLVRAEIIQKVIHLLCLLDKRSISIKGLFDSLRLSSNLTLRKSCKDQLEVLIGSQLDQASLDDLLLPSSHGKNHTMYNVNLVLRFLRNFLLEGNINQKLCSYRLRRVARLVDLYANEIAPDTKLKPSKFVSLAMVIPDSARDSYDKLYHSIEIYLEVHRGLREEKKMKVCSILNYDKLSPQVLNQLSHNTSFPLMAIVKALVYQKPKLKCCIKDHVKVIKSLGYDDACETEDFTLKQIVFKDQLSTNEKFRDQLQQMGWSVDELEKMFGQMQTQSVANVMTPKVCCIHNVRHLPKLCS